MGHANGVITRPVNTDDVVATIGESSHNVIRLCTSDKINRWAKYKPIRGGDYHTLPGEVFKGTAADKAEGIVFGLKCATRLNSLTGIHECDFSYVGKPGAGDWKRLDDFLGVLGYDHNAGPLPEGTVDTWVYAQMTSSLQVYFSFANGFHGTGVPVNQRWVAVDDIIKILDPSNAYAQLSAYYPCACVSVPGEGDYIRCLDSGPEPMSTALDKDFLQSHTMTDTGLVSGAWRNSWRVNLSGLEEASGVTFVEGQVLTVSIFFIKKILDIALSIDFSKWRRVSRNQMFPGLRAIGCPGAVNQRVELRRLYQPGLECSGLAHMGKDIMISVRRARKWSAETYHVVIYLYPPKEDGLEPLPMYQAEMERTFTTAGEESPGGIDLTAELVTLATSFGGAPGTANGFKKGTWKATWTVRVGTVITNRGSETLEI